MTSHTNKIVGEGLTYDDVLLVPNYSEVLPRDVDVRSKLTRNIALNIPIVSAAMDTVTESKMAIAMAQEGGIGVLHKNMSIEEQALKVRKVKRAESGMIMDPVTLPMDSVVRDAKQNMAEFSIGGIPVVDDHGKLKGIVTNRDLRFERNDSRPITEVMTSKNLVTVSAGTSLKDAEGILQQNKIEKLPVVDENNVLVGLITFRDITKLTNPVKPLSSLAILPVHTDSDSYIRGMNVAVSGYKTLQCIARYPAVLRDAFDTISNAHVLVSVYRRNFLQQRYPSNHPRDSYCLQSHSPSIIDDMSHSHTGYLGPNALSILALDDAAKLPSSAHHRPALLSCVTPCSNRLPSVRTGQ